MLNGLAGHRRLVPDKASRQPAPHHQRQPKRNLHRGEVEGSANCSLAARPSLILSQMSLSLRGYCLKNSTCQVLQSLLHPFTLDRATAQQATLYRCRQIQGTSGAP
jgi:hypothetical protein